MNVIEMETNPVKDQQISGLGPMPGKPEGSQFQLDQGILGGTVSVTAVPFGMALEFTWEMWRDEQYGYARESVREMARSSNNRQELDAWVIRVMRQLRKRAFRFSLLQVQVFRKSL